MMAEEEEALLEALRGSRRVDSVYNACESRLRKGVASDALTEAVAAHVESAGPCFNKHQRKCLRELMMRARRKEEEKKGAVVALHAELEADCERVVRWVVSKRPAWDAERVVGHVVSVLDVPVVVVGSVAVGLHGEGSDLDLCVVTEDNNVLQVAAERLGGELVAARVPVVKATCLGVHVDLSSASGGSIAKTERLREALDASKGARDLILLVKRWASVRKLNDSANFGVNSYAWALLCLSSASWKPIPSLGMGFFNFFDFLLSVDWQGPHCVALASSPNVVLGAAPEAMVRSKTPLVMCVQDPVFLGENTTRTVHEESLVSLLSEFVRARSLLAQGMPLDEVLVAPEAKRSALNAQWMKRYQRPSAPSAVRAASADRGTPRLCTVDFLRQRSSVSALCQKYKLVAKRHCDFPSLVQLSYQLGASPLGSPVTQECRGLIVDEADDFRVVSYPLGKFFNLGESKAAKVDWSQVRVYEKLDGSMMHMYWYAGAWRVASQRRPDAAGSFENAAEGGQSMAALFWRLFETCCKGALPREQGGYTFVFEICLQAHPVVVRHEADALTLIAVRRLADFQELELEQAASEGIVPQVWPRAQALSNFEPASPAMLLERAREMVGSRQEGLVVVDRHFSRLKVKAPSYVQMSLLQCERGALPSVISRRLLVLVLRGEAEEACAYFPEHADECRALEKRLTSFERALDEKTKLNWERCSGSVRCHLSSLDIKEVEKLLDNDE